MNVLFLGENVGKCGTDSLNKALKPLKDELKIDFTVINGEGTSMGYGIMPEHVRLLYKAGVDAVTLGEKTFFKSDMTENLGKFDRVLRPANYPEGTSGSGVKYMYAGSRKVCLINMLGMMSFQFPHLRNPYEYALDIVDKARNQTPFVFFVFHAQATAEKTSMGYLLNGKASCVIGTHTKVMTSNARILSGGTAYISDIGMCGASLGVGGFNPENEILKIRTGMGVRSKECNLRPQLQGVSVGIDDESGKAYSIETVIRDVY